MNSIVSQAKKEQLVNELVAIQQAELKITLAEWRARGFNRAKLRQAERDGLAKIKADTRRMVNEMYPESTTTR
jgi:hypothetical protein